MSHHRKQLSRARTEPAVVRGVIVAVLGALSVFGLSFHLTSEQISALAVLGALVLPLIQAAWTRLAVTANAKVIARVTSDGQVVAGDAAIATTGSVLPTTAAHTPTLAPVPVKPALVQDE